MARFIYEDARGSYDLDRDLYKEYIHLVFTWRLVKGEKEEIA